MVVKYSRDKNTVVLNIESSVTKNGFVLHDMKFGRIGVSENRIVSIVVYTKYLESEHFSYTYDEHSNCLYIELCEKINNVDTDCVFDQILFVDHKNGYIKGFEIIDVK